ncbi:MAG: hypothetical protein QNJ04_03355 [Desulfobacterales bacterium]|nr:hypothetical protein [Desulfobacterales bacterium]
MPQKSKANRGVIFACAKQRQAGCLPMDNNMRKVLRQIDGHRSLASVAFAAGLTMTELQEAIGALVLMKLIEPIDPNIQTYHAKLN